MSTRHRRTLAAVFRDPASSILAWDGVERLLVHHGATLRERRGSRVAVVLGGHTLTVHPPPPSQAAPQHVIRDVRGFLALAGVTP